jgi:hypothetical protein
MKEKAQGAWLTLNASYYAAPLGNPLALLADTFLLLEQAQSIVDAMREATRQTPHFNTQLLTAAMEAVDTLMKMSAGSAEAARVRFEEIGDAWLTGA